MNSIEKKQKEFVEEFNLLDDWFLQYEYLIRVAQEMKPMPQHMKTEANRIRGCQSKVWMNLSKEGDTVHLFLDSDALLVKGILGVLIYLLDGEKSTDILATELDFVQKTPLHKELPSSRVLGFDAIAKGLRDRINS